MAFRGRPTAEVPIGKCWCGAEAIRVDFGPDDSYDTCTSDVFHAPESNAHPQTPGRLLPAPVADNPSAPTQPNPEKGTSMTEASPWDDPELKQGEFYSFDTPGDTASGVVQSVGIHKWDDGKVCPQLKMTDDNGEDRTLTAGQAQLKAKLVELRPSAGDHLKVTYTQSEKRAGGKTLKHFDVVVNGGGQPQAAPAAPAAAQPVVADPAAAQAALNNLTDEQKAALGLLGAQG